MYLFTVIFIHMAEFYIQFWYVYMLWFNFILGSNFISFVSNSSSSNYHNQNKGNKIEPQHNIIYIVFTFIRFLDPSFIPP